MFSHTDDDVFDNFLKISEDFSKLFQRPDKHSRTLAKDFRERLEDVLITHP